MAEHHTRRSSGAPSHSADQARAQRSTRTAPRRSPWMEASFHGLTVKPEFRW